MGEKKVKYEAEVFYKHRYEKHRLCEMKLQGNIFCFNYYLESGSKIPESN